MTFQKIKLLIFIKSILSFVLKPLVDANGYLAKPMSRNYYANVNGVDIPAAGVPTKDYVYYMLNRNNGVCGVSTSNIDYDEFQDSTGTPMPWDSQENYQEGQYITVTVVITTNPLGHFTLGLCSDVDYPTMECIEQNPLEFIEDITSSMPKDVNYPERAYLPDSAGTFQYKFKLPMGVSGDKVIMNWRYYSGASCNHDGYDEYPWPDTSNYSDQLGDCGELNDYPTKDDGSPEQFFNCAEITIMPSLSPVTLSPTSKSPTLSSMPSSPPSRTPESSIHCSTGYGFSSWEALIEMDDITHEVSSDPYILSVVSSGSVFSEYQAHAMLISSMALVSLHDTDDEDNYSFAKKRFEGYFNGWRQMCRQSTVGTCQGTIYCDGESAPCLPAWKHNEDLDAVTGSGSTVNADEDAIAAMIIALQAVYTKDSSSLPSWYEEVYDWADRSCTQFLEDDTVSSNTRRLPKLGECWGGWESQGNTPSYQAPGHYRLMRDFQESVESRSYTLPSTVTSDTWNTLIETSYDFLQAVQCDDTGLVPNWALAKEEDDGDVSIDDGSFTGSGEPQYQFGSTASKTMWRIAFDAAIYPEEASEASWSFLEPIHQRLYDGFDFGSEDFADDTLQECETVTSIILDGSRWMYLYYVSTPVLSTLANYFVDISPLSFNEQKVMVDAACANAQETESLDDYSLIWQLLGMVILNGDVAKAGEIFRERLMTSFPSEALTSSTPSKEPSSIPTNTPTYDPTSNATNYVYYDFTDIPTKAPDFAPAQEPTDDLTPVPTNRTTNPPSLFLTDDPTSIPTSVPTNVTTNPPSLLLTDDPTSLVTFVPTEETSNSSSDIPTSVSTAFCCTWDFFHCTLDHYCNLSSENCHVKCGGTWIKKSSTAMACIQKHGDCTTDQNSCCESLICSGDAQSYMECVDDDDNESTTPVVIESMSISESIPITACIVKNGDCGSNQNACCDPFVCVKNEQQQIMECVESDNSSNEGSTNTDGGLYNVRGIVSNNYKLPVLDATNDDDNQKPKKNITTDGKNSKNNVATDDKSNDVSSGVVRGKGWWYFVSLLTSCTIIVVEFLNT